MGKRLTLARAVARIRRSTLSRCFHLWRDRFGEVDDYTRKRKQVGASCCRCCPSGTHLPGSLVVSQLVFVVLLSSRRPGINLCTSKAPPAAPRSLCSSGVSSVSRSRPLMQQPRVNPAHLLNCSASGPNLRPSFVKQGKGEQSPLLAAWTAMHLMCLCRKLLVSP